MAAKDKEDIVSVGFIALGCGKNVVDSEKMLALLGRAGFVLTGEIENADVVVINTCGFIKPAKDEALEAIREAVNLKKRGTVRKVIVAGCLAQRMGKTLTDEIDGIDAVVGLGCRDEIDRIVTETITPPSAANRASVAKEPQPECRFYLKDAGRTVSDDRERLLITPGHWAYLRISEGCDRKCSFCTIPAIRGAFRSKDEALILSEAQELVASGAVELDLIAQDSSFYGKDSGLKNGLSRLIRGLEKIDRLQWVRLMYLHPAGIGDELIETIAGSQKVVNYIDMPIQHISNDILKDMRRSERRADTTELIEKLRRAMGDVILRTTIITGFPGETHAHFEELLDFIRWAKFDALGCFTFYPEAGTPAADMPGQVPEQLKQERADELMAVQQKIAFAKAEARIGSEITCLVDNTDDPSTALGRFYGQAPNIDSICYIENCKAEPGEFISARVAGTRDYDLVVKDV